MENNTSVTTFEHGVQGYVKPGFEHVLDEFQQMIIDGDDKRSQLCVFVGEEMVLDLYKGVSPDAITTIFSSGKSIAAILMGVLHDKGLFQYDDPVVKHWPEFCNANSKNGKDKITIADVMRHEGGMPKLDQGGPFHIDAIKTEGVKNNVIGKVIEETDPFWEKNSRREYHAGSRDWISGEVFRRLEPQGRTMSEYLKAEIWPLIESKNIVSAAKDDELDNYVQLEMHGAWKTFKDMWKGPEKGASVSMPLGKAMS